LVPHGPDIICNYVLLARKPSGSGQVEQDRQNRKVRTEQAEWDRQNGTGRTGQAERDRLVGTGRKGQAAGQAENDRQN
jgi:hypothetical protein